MKTLNRFLITFICSVSLFGTHSVANEIQQLDIVDQLEHRVARDVAAYLGHNRFIVNIDVALSPISITPPAPTSQVQNTPEVFTRK